MELVRLVHAEPEPIQGDLMSDLKKSDESSKQNGVFGKLRSRRRSG